MISGISLVRCHWQLLQLLLLFRLGILWRNPPLLPQLSRLYEQINRLKDTCTAHEHTHSCIRRNWICDAIEFEWAGVCEHWCDTYIVQFSADKSNWLLITEYDFDNNRHTDLWLLFNMHNPIRDVIFYKFAHVSNRINVMNTHPRPDHTHAQAWRERGGIAQTLKPDMLQFNNKLNYC